MNTQFRPPSHPADITKRLFAQHKQVLFIPLLLVALLPLTAHAQAGGSDPVLGLLNWVVDKLSNTWAKALAVIVLCGLGYAAWVGKLSWGLVGGFLGGCVLIFGGAEIYEALRSEV